MINKIIIYGRSSLVTRICNEIKERFKVNPFNERRLRSRGIGVYVPKLNKLKFGVSILIALICIVLPLITLFSVPVILWGIKWE